MALMIPIPRQSGSEMTSDHDIESSDAAREFAACFVAIFFVPIAFFATRRTA